MRYIRKGQCNRCGACCIIEDPPCPHLKWNGKIAICNIYNNPNRPLRCKLFPESPPIPSQFDKCGYYFIDTWNNDEIVKDMIR